MSALKRPKRRANRSSDSFWYDRGVPALLIILGVVTVGLIVLALAVLFRVVSW
jgi:uncharacterized integral membrane protein